MAYNTTPFHGKVARIEKNDVAVNFTVGYSINVNLKMADKTSQGADWDSALPGTTGATGNMDMHLVAGNAEQKALLDNIITATPGTLLSDVKFLLDGSTNAFTGNIYITGFTTSTSVGDVVKCSFPFQVDDALTLTDAA